MKKEAQGILKIFIICSLLVGIVSLEMIALKVLKTAGDLAILNDNARFYNEQSVKTDRMTQEFLKNEAERQKIYNSDDSVVRIYSNSHAIIKFMVLIVAGMVVVVVPLSVGYLLFLSFIDRRQVKTKKEQLIIRAKK